MENNPETQQEKTQLIIEENLKPHLYEISRWARFLGWAGMFVCIMVILSIFISGGQIFKEMNKMGNLPTGVNTNSLLIVFAVFLMAPLYLSFLLSRFGKRLKVALDFDRQDYLNHSFLNLKIALRTIGIIAVLYLAAVLLGPLLGGLIK